MAARAVSQGVPFRSHRMFVAAYQLPAGKRKGKWIWQQEIRPLLWLDQLFVLLSRGMAVKARESYRKKISRAADAAFAAKTTSAPWVRLPKLMFLYTLLSHQKYGLREFAPEEEQDVVFCIDTILQHVIQEGNTPNQRLLRAAYQAVGKAASVHFGSLTLNAACFCFALQPAQAVNQLIQHLRLSGKKEQVPHLKLTLLKYLLQCLEAVAPQKARRARRASR